MWWHSIVCSLSLFHVFLLIFSSSSVLVGYYFWWCIYYEFLLIDWMSFSIDNWLLLMNDQLFIGGVLLMELVIVVLPLMIVVFMCSSLFLWHLTLILRWLYIFGLGICMLTWYEMLVLEWVSFWFWLSLLLE